MRHQKKKRRECDCEAVCGPALLLSCAECSCGERHRRIRIARLDRLAFRAPVRPVRFVRVHMRPTCRGEFVRELAYRKKVSLQRMKERGGFGGNAGKNIFALPAASRLGEFATCVRCRARRRYDHWKRQIFRDPAGRLVFSTATLALRSHYALRFGLESVAGPC